MRFLLSSPKLELLLVLMDSLTMLQSLFSWITQCSTAINLKGFLMRSLIIHRCLLHSSEKGAMDETRKLYELNAMLDAEESLMRQKSRVLWLKNGDRKTRTIWAALSERRARKTLRSIKDDNGHMVNGETSIKAAAVSHFQNILRQIRSCNVNSNFQFERVLTEDQ